MMCVGEWNRLGNVDRPPDNGHTSMHMSTKGRIIRQQVTALIPVYL